MVLQAVIIGLLTVALLLIAIAFFKRAGGKIITPVKVPEALTPDR
jgi:hypothetical protein